MHYCIIFDIQFSFRELPHSFSSTLRIISPVRFVWWNFNLLTTEIRSKPSSKLSQPDSFSQEIRREVVRSIYWSLEQKVLGCQRYYDQTRYQVLVHIAVSKTLSQPLRFYKICLINHYQCHYSPAQKQRYRSHRISMEWLFLKSPTSNMRLQHSQVTCSGYTGPWIMLSGTEWTKILEIHSALTSQTCSWSFPLLMRNKRQQRLWFFLFLDYRSDH